MEVERKFMDDIAKEYAISCHRNTNHCYDDKPYEYHLQMVVDVAKKFLYLVPQIDQIEVLGGCWVHDVLEDTRQTFNQIKENTNITIAEYSYALANEKGKTRKDRANSKYYEEIKSYKHASFIKLCDRIANVTYSKNVNSSMFVKYKKEMKDFKNQLYDNRWREMWEYLETLIN